MSDWRELFSLMMIPAAGIIVIVGLLAMSFLIVAYSPQP